MKASPAFGRRRLHTNTDYVDCTSMWFSFGWNRVLVENVIGWKCRNWMKVFWMEVSLDESVIGWNRVWMKVYSTTWAMWCDSHSQTRAMCMRMFHVITKIEGHELKIEKCVEGWAGWAHVSETEKAKFQVIVFCHPKWPWWSRSMWDSRGRSTGPSAWQVGGCCCRD